MRGGSGGVIDAEGTLPSLCASLQHQSMSKSEGRQGQNESNRWWRRLSPGVRMDGCHHVFFRKLHVHRLAA